MRYITYILLAIFLLPIGILAITEEDKIIIQEIAKEESLLIKLETEITKFSDAAYKRREILQLEANNETDKIVKLFSEDIKYIDEFIKSGDTNNTISEYQRLKLIYRSIPEVLGDLKFYKSEIAGFIDSTNVRKSLLSQVVENFPNAINFNEAVYNYQELLFKNGEDELLVDSYKSMTRDNYVNDQDFWYAQALYNLGDYVESKNVFNSLIEDGEFSYRAKLMVILIAYEESLDVKLTIKEMKNLQEEFDSSEEYYFTGQLLIARLYFADENYADAIESYENLIQMQSEKMNDSIKLELANLYFITSDFEKAYSICNAILENPENNQSYSDANELLALIQLERISYNDAVVDIEAALSNIKKIYEQLELKHQYLEKKRQLFNEFKDAVSEEDRKDIEFDIERNDLRLAAATSKLEELSLELNPDFLYLIEKFENRIEENNEIIVNIHDQIRELRATHNEKIPAMIDKEIALIDSARIRLKTLKYVSNLTEVTIEDFEIAYKLAKELFHYEKIIEKSNKIINDAKGNELISAKELKSEAESNIGYLNSLVDFNFGLIDTSKDIQQQIALEESSLIAKQDSLIYYRNEIWANYNNILADQLSEESAEFNEDNNYYVTLYKDLINEIRAHIKVKEQEYEFTKIDLMYEQAKDQFMSNNDETGVEKE